LSIKPVALAMVKASHELEAELEILDCILPYDLEARAVKISVPGVIIIESRLCEKEVISILKNCFVSQAKKIIPINKVVRNDVNEILDNVIVLSEAIESFNRTFRVELKSYAKIDVDRELVEKIVEKLKEKRGWKVDLKNPDIIVFLHIFDWGTLLSLVERKDILDIKGLI